MLENNVLRWSKSTEELNRPCPDVTHRQVVDGATFGGLVGKTVHLRQILVRLREVVNDRNDLTERNCNKYIILCIATTYYKALLRPERKFLTNELMAFNLYCSFAIVKIKLTYVKW